jgi:hypothetical protein
MPIPVTCPGCKRSFNTPDKNLGKTIRCHVCGHPLVAGEAMLAAVDSASAEASEASEPSRDGPAAATVPTPAPAAPPSPPPAAAQTRRRVCASCGARMPWDTPKCACGVVFKTDEERAVSALATKLANFGHECNATGMSWIAIGAVPPAAVLGLIGTFAVTEPGGPPLDATAPVAAVLAAVAVTWKYSLPWLIVGVGACLRQTWALAFGGLLSIAALGWTIWIGQGWLCAGTILIPLAAEAFRLIPIARELDAAGVPLDADPAEVEARRRPEGHRP